MYFRKYGPNFRKNRNIPRVPNVKCSFSCKFYYILCIFYYKLQVDPVPEISRAHTFFPGLLLTAQCFLLLVDSQNLRCRVMVDKLEKYFRKLMCWCPMKDSLLKGRQEDFLSGFKSENGNGLISFSIGLREGRVLRTQFSLFPDIWDIPIIIFAPTIVFMIWTGIYDSFMLLSVFYLCLIPYLFIKYRLGTVSAILDLYYSYFFWLHIGQELICRNW
jgi:hypothetical protein